jgi:hypothetical protein
LGVFVDRRVDMLISRKWVAALLVLAYWGGSGVRCALAQDRPTAAELVQELRSAQTTDAAKGELLKLGTSGPEARNYLAVHLPPLIENGPTRADCPGNSCGPWINTVELAGQLKIVEAAPALAKWINWREPGRPVVGIPIEAGLIFYPAARALIKIGDPGIPAVQDALESGNSGVHYPAVRVLCIINSASAKAALRDDLGQESDPQLRAMIKRALDQK